METGENIYIPQITIDKKDQTSNLARKMTGFEIEDPSIKKHLINEHENILKKYHLPNEYELLNDPWTYYQKIKGILNEDNIVLYKSDPKDVFFQTNPDCLASYFSESKSILVNEAFFTQKDSLNKDLLLMSALTHEAIHAFQDKYFPNMDIEHQEYEANIGSLPLSFFKDESNRNNLDVRGLFTSINQSVEIYNRQANNNST